MYKVFIVEDEIVVREGIQQNIAWEQYGFTYAGDAQDGELALPLIRRIQPDLLITDIKMPFMDGLSLIKLVREELPNTKIVIISGYDDFSYAQQAIRMGVEQYLLKPIVKDKMVELLKSIHKKMDSEQKQKEYYVKFQQEAQEYEDFSRRRFFEKIVTGCMSVSEISQKAKAWAVDLNAPFYNIVLFSFNNAGYNRSAPENYTDNLALVQDMIMKFILNHEELILFRWNVTVYAVLVKGSEENAEQKTSYCIENIQRCCLMAGNEIEWHISSGNPVERLSEIPVCFNKASHILSYRHLCPKENILTDEIIQKVLKKNNINSTSNTCVLEINQQRICNFLNNGEEEEIDLFIEQMILSIGDQTSYMPILCKYLAMTIYLGTDEYLASMGWRADSFWPLDYRPDIDIKNPEELRDYVYKVIEHVIGLRNNESKKQHRFLLMKALSYIDKNYSEESISLDKVARTVNISPNYFSAMFSQEIGQTFVGYLTNKRIEKAKGMLKYTDKRSSEIAFDVGYKDPHYFSFVFKKISGCTPSEYRRGDKN